MNIILIEPDAILARQYEKAFTNAGVNVRVVYDAQSALGDIDRLTPDVVVMEMQLSGHSGVEFLHEFRSYEDWSNIPIVVHSSVPEYALGVDDKIWRRFGVDRYFYKPKTSLQQLIGAVKTIDTGNEV